MLNITHKINLDTLGGIENIFNYFIKDIKIRQKYNNSILTKQKINKKIKESICNNVNSVYYIKYYKGIKIPSFMKSIRKHNLCMALTDMNPDVILLWSDLSDSKILDILNDKQYIIYYDHGSAWTDSHNNYAKRFLENVDGIICNSFASKRMLSLRWGIENSKVCMYGIRPDVASYKAKPKSLSTKNIRLGTIGRIKSLKGIPLCMHTAKILFDKGYNVELHVGGVGEEKKDFQNLASRLGMERQIIFRDYIDEVNKFYQMIDIYLCLSLREPFGLVNIEAASHGCIVIGTKVDGIPESIIRDGVTGYTIRPELHIDQYYLYGGKHDKSIPRVTYDPENDTLSDPHFVSPEAVADKILDLINNPDDFHEMSHKAICLSKQKYDFNDYVNNLSSIIDLYCET